MNKLEVDTAVQLGRAEAYLEMRLNLIQDSLKNPGQDKEHLEKSYDECLANLESVRQEIRALNMEYNADKDRLDREIGRE